MNNKLKNLASRRGGWFSRREALACGYTDSEIRQRVLEGRWIRLCRGAYAEKGGADEKKPKWERERLHHVLVAQAIQDRLGKRVAISHQTATAAYGLPTWGLDLSKVHVTRLAGHGRSDREVVQHAGRLVEADLSSTAGGLATSVARSVADAARLTSYESAVVVADAALQRRLVTSEQLSAELAAVGGRIGASTAIKALRFADARAESPGESRLRVLLADHGFPLPTLQAQLSTATGEFVARVDFLFDDAKVVIEFDGESKYGEDGAEVVAEKWREDRIRELGYVVVRVSWSDLATPEKTAERVRAAFERAARRR
ncbi:MAG TPA: type IV toxin-antitoxin system AbiEi family antitoxin domain-containing protein [Kribbellaceae bacterium]|nr:type IV toxin-antitoxin system AbiEi family antitoxin domain-containing protein [Kribbellaceae bacterium]